MQKLQIMSDVSDKDKPDAEISFYDDGTTEVRDIFSTNSARSLRDKKPAQSLRTVCCPVCGLSIQLKDIAAHTEIEVKKLDSISKTVRLHPSERDTGPNNGHPKSSRRRSSRKSHQQQASSSTHFEVDTAEPMPLTHDVRWEYFRKIKRNRNERLTAKTATNSRKRGRLYPGEEEVKCPVCQDLIRGTMEFVTQHVEECLESGPSNSAANAGTLNVNVEGDDDSSSGDTFNNSDEYVWNPDVRGLSVTNSNFIAMTGGVASRVSYPKPGEDDEDIEIEGDEDMFGEAQFTESDIIAPSGQGVEEKALRRALASSSDTRSTRDPGPGPSSSSSVSAEDDSSRPDPPSKWNTVSDLPTASVEETEITVSNSSLRNDAVAPSQSALIDLLKNRIRELESEQGAKTKCLICFESYTLPVVSIGCWHVYCQECWLRTLGDKKLCPQCKMITSANHLRRIYL